MGSQAIHARHCFNPAYFDAGSVRTTPLKIGVMNDLSSVYADFQGIGSRSRLTLLVADYAKSAGAPLEVTIGDPQNKPDIGSGVAWK